MGDVSKCRPHRQCTLLHHIIGNEDVIYYLCSFLSIQEFLSLSVSCKDNYYQLYLTSSYSRLRRNSFPKNVSATFFKHVIKQLVDANININVFKKILLRFNAIISGSFVFSSIMNETYNNSDIDIYVSSNDVPCQYVKRLMKSLKKELNLSSISHDFDANDFYFRERNKKSCCKLMNHIRHVFTFWTTTMKKIQVVVVRGDTAYALSKFDMSVCKSYISVISSVITKSEQFVLNLPNNAFDVAYKKCTYRLYKAYKCNNYLYLYVLCKCLLCRLDNNMFTFCKLHCTYCQSSTFLSKVFTETFLIVLKRMIKYMNRGIIIVNEKKAIRRFLKVLSPLKSLSLLKDDSLEVLEKKIHQYRILVFKCKM
jgi:hypothetical protein